VDIGNAINYVTAATYGPDNALTGFISGNSAGFAGITNKFFYASRLQPSRMLAGTGIKNQGGPKPAREFSSLNCLSDREPEVSGMRARIWLGRGAHAFANSAFFH
jgi:hypothetical protein